MDVEELLWAGADAQAAALRDGTVTAPDLLEAVLNRLNHVDEKLNAFRVVWADQARAQAADAQRGNAPRCWACRSRSRTTWT
jgi:amidase